MILKLLGKQRNQTVFLFEGEKFIPLCYIYEGVCSCKKNYIGEPKWSVITRWNEHENPKKDPEPAKHLFQHPDHVFQY